MRAGVEVGVEYMGGGGKNWGCLYRGGRLTPLPAPAMPQRMVKEVHLVDYTFSAFLCCLVIPFVIKN